MSKLKTGGTRTFRRERAMMELTLRIIQFLDKFESKEEPTVKLTYSEKTEVLANMLAKRVSKLSKNKK